MKNINDLKKWYESLNEESLKDIRDFYHEESFFKDPFNEFESRDKIEHIFKDMFIKLNSPRFEFIDILDKENETFITWDFLFSVGERPFRIHGSTFLKWRDGKIYYHRDYWDVGEELLLKVPVLKTIYGVFRNKMSHN